VSNPLEELLPGMFGAVSLEYGAPTEVLTIPSSGVTYATYGNSVYVVEHKKDEKGEDTQTVRQQIVQLGRSHGDLVAILKGIAEGDEVVTTGAFKLRPGARVQIQERGKPPESTQPAVENS
jgi:membrane fusion protein (multidrug efflux system)